MRQAAARQACRLDQPAEFILVHARLHVGDQMLDRRIGQQGSCTQPFDLLPALHETQAAEGWGHVLEPPLGQFALPLQVTLNGHLPHVAECARRDAGVDEVARDRHRGVDATPQGPDARSFPGIGDVVVRLHEQRRLALARQHEIVVAVAEEA